MRRTVGHGSSSENSLCSEQPFENYSERVWLKNLKKSDSIGVPKRSRNSTVKGVFIYMVAEPA